MARVNRVFTTKAVADLIGEDIELVEQISCNSDNIDYGEIIHVVDGSEYGETGFTDRGIECIQELLTEARHWKGGLRQFLIAEHCDPEVVDRIMAKEQARIDAQKDLSS